MMILQTSKLAIHDPAGRLTPGVYRLSKNEHRPQGLRPSEIFVSDGGPLPEGFLAYIHIGVEISDIASLPEGVHLGLPGDFAYLDDGDVVRIVPDRQALRVLYRRTSPHNSFLVTERCNHYCLMCSQPPRNVEDSYIVDELLQTIPLIHPDTQEIGFTGGEPTLLGDRFLDLVQSARSYLPQTSLHILSNGRRFSDATFAKKYAAIEHPDVMLGIPLYSDVSTIHDYVVQAHGAYDETLRGILNLKRLRQKVEIRVVIHRQTYDRLPQLAEFIARNLTFIDHVALMGLEMTGFTRANLPALWIDPIDYMDELYRATTLLAGHRMNVSIYNHQLCLLDRRIWPFAVKSISDWKNEYMPECAGCEEMDLCGGFFSSAHFRYSDHISPISAEPPVRVCG
jgi:His-Xaa-Ser system radical SAM maturase HxsC